MEAAAAGFIHPDWAAPANVKALVTTRQAPGEAAGDSAPPFHAFNLAAHVGDAPGAVAANRQRLTALAALPAPPLWLQQVHGGHVVRHEDSLSEPVPAPGEDKPPQADAAATALPGRVCAVLTADCLPVFYCDAEGSRVAVAHAGWRGLHAGVLQSTLESLRCAPEKVRVWLGPAIGPEAFEVGQEVRDAFVSLCRDHAQAFRRIDAGHYLCDLYRLAQETLHRAGVRHISGGGFCTFSDAGRFFSYRRDGRTGRMASLIWME